MSFIYAALVRPNAPFDAGCVVAGVNNVDIGAGLREHRPLDQPHPEDAGAAAILEGGPMHSKPYDDLEQTVAFAVATAKQAGNLILSVRGSIAIEHKADGSEVTEADRDAERLIRSRIEDLDPQARVLGEEFGGESRPIEGYQWVVDPLDGTTPFSIGSPMFGTLIALLEDGNPVVGVVHLPALRETLWAASGRGCWFEADGIAPIRVTTSGCASLDDAFVSTSGLHGTELQPIADRQLYSLSPLIGGARKLRVVGDCVQHALVSRGRIDLAIDAAMQPWDSAALVPCIREAGGAVSGIDGSPDDPVFGGSLVTAASDSLLEQAMAAMTP